MCCTAPPAPSDSPRILAALALGASAAPAQAAADPMLDDQWGLTDVGHRRAGGLDAVAR